jgi:hypothetical protein
MLRHPVPTLPKATALCDLATEPALVPERLDPTLRSALASRLAAVAPGRGNGPLRLDSWTVLNGERGPKAEFGSFTWSPRAARRLLGVASARRVVMGQEPSPTVAARREVDWLIARASAGDSRPGSLGAWLAEAPRGVLGAVLAEAISHATELVSLLDWGQLGPRATLGGADPVWAVPGAPWISLRGRRDAEITLDGERGTRALLCLRAGRPAPSARHDLAIVALSDALAHPDHPLPTRVLGVWPSAGKAVSLEIGREEIRGAARLVVDAACRLRQPDGLALVA